jgi:signal transduction histidine kinase
MTRFGTRGTLQRMRLRRLRPSALDALVVLVGVWQQVQLWTSPDPGPEWVVVPLSLAATVALLARERFPLAARVGVFAALGLWAVVAPHDRPSSASYFLGAMLAFWVAGFAPSRTAAGAGWVAGIAVMAYGESVFPGGGAGEFLFTALIQTGVWAAGFALRGRSRHARTLEADLAVERERREERARHAVVEERARIARELHDVIAHNLSVAIIQLTAADRELPSEPTPTRLAGHVAAAEASCRQALAEMRLLVGVLRPGEQPPALEPSPRLSAAGALFDAVREAGVSLEVEVEGEPVDAPAHVEVAAYRILQEALTNALKHGGGTPTRVGLRYQQDEIEIGVVNQGVGATNGDGGGRGLVGMRERVALYGGTLVTGPDADGFRVHATIPLGPHA